MAEHTTEHTDPQPIAKVAHELVRRHPSLLIVGSLARAAHMGAALDEYRASGVRRDVDGLRFHEREERILPREDVVVDLGFEKWIRHEANGTYLVFPKDEGLAVEVPFADDVFAPYEAEVNGETIRVPHADTIGAIATMQYIQRPKDKQAMRAYTGYLDSLEDAARLPGELLYPFDKFRAELSRRRAYVGMSYVRNLYHRAVPEQLRQDISIRERAGNVFRLFARSR